MAEIGYATMPVIPSIKGSTGVIERELAGAGQRGGKKMSAGIVGGLKGVAGPIAAFVALDKIGGFFKDANDEARESQKVGAVTTQVIKATGGAAKITATQVGNLATSISNKAGVDDEAIQSGANLLLTFKNVKNEAGSGGKIFDRATAAAVDLSATGFGSITGSSKMLGKALNDPVKGISALGRAGVTFTDQQKEQIATLTKSGDVLGAQKIILKEVESQVGGTAAASATAGEKMSVAFGNFKEQIGTALLPAIDSVEGIITTKVIPGLSKFVGFLSTNIPLGIDKVKSVFGPLVTTVSGFFTTLTGGQGPVTAFSGLLSRAGSVISTAVVPALRNVGGFITTSVLPGLRLLGTFILTNVIPALAAVGRFILTSVVPGFLAIQRTVLRLYGVVAPIIIAIVGVIISKFTQMRPQIIAIWGSVQGIIVGVMAVIQRVVSLVTTVVSFLWAKFGAGILKATSGAFGAIITIIGGAMRVVLGVVNLVLALLTGNWKKAGASLGVIARGIGAMLKGVFTLIRVTVGALVVALLTFLLNKWRGFLTWSGSVLKAGLLRVKGFIVDPIVAGKARLITLISDLRGRWSGFTTWLSTTLKTGLAKVQGFITAPVNLAKSALKTILGAKGIQGVFSSAVTQIGKIWSGLQALAKKPVSFIINTVLNGGLIKAFNAVAKILPGVKTIPNVAIKGFRRGGILPGQSSWRDGDDQLVPMRRGEGVYVSEAMRDPYERARLHAVNEAAMRGQSLDQFRAGFAKGGVNDKLLERLRRRGISLNGVAGEQNNRRPEGLQGYAKGGLNIAGAQRFARSQVGARYNWAASGPKSRGYDCSGFMSAITNYLRGRNPYHRVGSTGNFPWSGFERGPGEFTIGSASRFPGSGVGHMAGTLGGLNVESSGGKGVHVGAGARGYKSRGFNKVYHLGNAGDYGGGGTGDVSFIDYLGKLKDKIAGPLNRLKELGSSPMAMAARAVPSKLASEMLSTVKNAAKNTIGNVVGKIGDVVTGGTNRARGLALMLKAGFGPGQWPSLNKLWTRESGWNHHARNKSSGAYGIPQSLPGSKMASVAGDWRTNPNTQIRWGLGYIRDRYGSPRKAWAHSQDVGWYANGAHSAPGGWSVVGERGRELVKLPKGTQVKPHGQSERMLTGRDITVQIDVHGDVVDPQGIAEAARAGVGQALAAAGGRYIP